MRPNNKGFTLAEYMIVFVIIALITAMAFPAFVKIKTNMIAKQVYHGQTVSESDYRYFQEHRAQVNDEYKRHRVVGRDTPNTPTVIEIDGKRYRLVPE